MLVWLSLEHGNLIASAALDNDISKSVNTCSFSKSKGFQTMISTRKKCILFLYMQWLFIFTVYFSFLDQIRKIFDWNFITFSQNNWISTVYFFISSLNVMIIYSFIGQKLGWIGIPLLLATQKIILWRI